MKNVGCRSDRRHGHLAGNAGAEIMAGKTELADMNRKTLAFIQRVLDRVRCGKCLRAEQKEGQQEVGQMLFHSNAV